MFIFMFMFTNMNIFRNMSIDMDKGMNIRNGH